MRRITLLLLTSLSFLTFPYTTRAGSFTEIYDPNGVHNYADSPLSVSADGSTVVGTETVGPDQDPFRWTQGTGAVGLGLLNDSGSLPHAFGTGVSADGSVVIGTQEYSGNRTQATRWTATGGLVGLGDIPNPNNPAPGPLSTGAALTSDGLTVFGHSASGAYQWTQSGGMVLLQPSNFFPFGASGDGSVLVGQQSSQAVRWTQAAGIMGLGFLPAATQSLALAVSQDGTTAVGYSGSAVQSQAFRWTSALGMVGLGFLNGFSSSQSMAVSADGSVIVGRDTNFGGPGSDEAFIWDPVHGMRNLQQVLTSDGLNLTGWSLQEGTGISPDGNTIVGDGVDPNGIINAWIAVVPEPSTALLLAFGLTALAAKRYRLA